MAPRYRPAGAETARVIGNADCEALDQRRSARHLRRDMSDDTPDSLIPYDEIVQEALRAVVGRVLGEVEATGGELPGNHHFYITFKTGAPGVSIPPHLRERFPDEMTIVLQNKFWDLDGRRRRIYRRPDLQPGPGEARRFRSPRSPPSSIRRSISGCSSRRSQPTHAPPEHARRCRKRCARRRRSGRRRRRRKTVPTS